MDNYDKVRLGTVTRNFDARRVPLSNRERQDRRGRFPYYGATGVMDHVDSYLFDGLYLLIAEDGSVEASNGAPVLQLVDGKFWVNNHAHVLQGASPDDTRFLYHALSTVMIRPFITGSVQAKLSQQNLNRIEIPYPSEYAVRREIARILGSFDNKIKVNKEINDNLEGMLRGIFQSWFIDFEPVHLKVAGKANALPKPLADLFPNDFMEWENGKIPVGWTATRLPDVIAVNPPRAIRRGARAPYLDMGNMPTDSARALNVTDREFASGMRFIDGDTLVARITPCLENGKTCFVDFLGPGTVGWGSTEYIVLRPYGSLPPEFAYFLARTERFRAHAIANMTGTSGRQRVPAAAFDQFVIVVPTPEVSERFGAIAASALRCIKGNDDESGTLVELRDALLPKMISGTIEVPAARQESRAIEP